MTLKATPIQRLGDRSALLERYTADTDGPGIGVMWCSDLAVSAGTGMQSSIAAGKARIRAGSGSSDRGVYDFWSDVAATATHNAADATNPRIDQVMARVRDVAEIGGLTNAGDFYVQHGTPTSGATLDARTGVTTPDPSSLLLADVLVPAGAGSSAGFTYRDRRQQAVMGAIPPMKTVVNQVAFLSAGVPIGWYVPGSNGVSTAMNGFQCECLFYLPQRIVASKIKWFCRQGSPAAVGNYNIGVYDSMGLKLAETGAIAFPASNSLEVKNITSTQFEPGLYRVVAGYAISSGSFATYGCHTGASGQGGATVPAQNLMSHLTSGGTTLPAHLQASTWSDASVSFASRTVPWIALGE